MIKEKKYIRALTIAGFDGSGGAGIQADIKSFSALGCYAMSVLTALPVQNTTGIKSVYSVDLSCIKEQCESIFDDIGVDALKIGMVHDIKIIELIHDIIQKYKPKNIVLDPVMVAKTGHSLIKDDAVMLLKELLIPHVDVITPNLPEAERLLGRKLINMNDIENGGKELLSLNVGAVIMKGGHYHSDNSTDDSTDYLITKSYIKSYSAPRIITKNDHGTGCTFSAAIAAYLGHGYKIDEAVEYAKDYISEALRYGADYRIGHGHGPVHHFYRFW